MISNKSISMEIAFYEDLKKWYKKRGRNYPEGEICFKYEHGKHRPYLKKHNERKYLNAQEKTLISRLISKKIELQKLECIDNNIRLLDAIQTEYKGAEWIFGNNIELHMEETIGRGFKVEDYLLERNKAANKSADFRKGEKIHTTTRDLKVRSKAELVIATFLDMKGVKYIYEQPLKLAYRTVAPDFTIIRKSDGKKIVWEHFGAMEKPGYFDDTMDKLHDYHYSGWLPYDNFVATFGEKDSPMDMTELEVIYHIMLK
ncbi:MAG: hypothetical protein Q4B18_03870 [Bacillota bacterium]|nr:hypothetical protein [Bacillota bacterium]